MEGDFQGDVIADTIDGFAGADTIAGYGADDVLRGGDGSDYVDGGEGNDLLIGDVVPGVTLNANELGAANDTLVGNIGNDLIYGDDGSDSLVGGEGIDLIAGGRGNDTMDGGTGADIFSVTAFFGASPNTFYTTGNDLYILRPGDSSISAFDLFEMSSQAAAFDGAGAAGGDRIDLRDMPGTIFLNTPMAFGPGIGAQLAGARNQRVDAFINNLSGVVTWFAVDLNDDGLLTDADLLVKFNAGISLVALDFGLNDARDAQPGTVGDDSLSLGTASDFVRAGAGRDTVRGGDGADYLLGEGAADSLFGDAGNDTLSGGADRDVLFGGVGGDCLDGGSGADRFAYRSAAESGTTTATRDRIVDFMVGSDRIDLAQIDAI
jgi:Ca2+-binding RTX toxin-like protein